MFFWQLRSVTMVEAGSKISLNSVTSFMDDHEICYYREIKSLLFRICWFKWRLRASIHWTSWWAADTDIPCSSWCSPGQSRTSPPFGHFRSSLEGISPESSSTREWTRRSFKSEIRLDKIVNKGPFK